jgi:hypothetical protein
MAHSHHIQMPCCGFAPNAHLGSGKCPDPARPGFPRPGYTCTYGCRAAGHVCTEDCEKRPSSPDPFTIHHCACGKPCTWCEMAEDLRVRNPFPRAKPEARPKQCDMNPHQCSGCFERDALESHAKGDPSVMVFECNPTRPK